MRPADTLHCLSQGARPGEVDVWRGRGVRVAAGVALALGIALSPAALGPPHSVRASDPVATVIAKYRTRIPELMAQQHVPGLAVALRRREIQARDLHPEDVDAQGLAQ